MSANTEAYVTLATNDSYAIGAIALGHSLRQSQTHRKLVVMISDAMTDKFRTQLSSIYDEIVHVNVLDSHDQVNLNLLARPDLGVTFTKLHCWRLTQYTKCVFMDADTIVLENIDELFDRQELSAAPDVGWPDCFNSGVFVFEPSLDTYNRLLQFALQHGSYDGGDQGLLNLFFSDWATKDISKHLSFVYNCVAQVFYSYLPAYKRFQSSIKVLHFIGAVKPWNMGSSSGAHDQSADTESCSQQLETWWRIFRSCCSHEQIKDLLPSNVCSGGSKHYTRAELSDSRRRHDWEGGKIDYMGIDSFQHIQKQIDTVIKVPAVQSAAKENDHKRAVIDNREGKPVVGHEESHVKAGAQVTAVANNQQVIAVTSDPKDGHVESSAKAVADKRASSHVAATEMHHVSSDASKVADAAATVQIAGIGDKNAEPIGAAIKQVAAAADQAVSKLVVAGDAAIKQVAAASDDAAKKLAGAVSATAPGGEDKVKVGVGAVAAEGKLPEGSKRSTVVITKGKRE